MFTKESSYVCSGITITLVYFAVLCVNIFNSSCFCAQNISHVAISMRGAKSGRPSHPDIRTVLGLPNYIRVLLLIIINSDTVSLTLVFEVC
jgi:hypothetical protein